MRILAKRKMPASLVGECWDGTIGREGWPTDAVSEYIDEFAVDWGVPRNVVDSISNRIRHTTSDSLDYYNKDLFIVHYLKKNCNMRGQLALCVRITRSQKTIIFAEHEQDNCKRIHGRSKR
jgi:hypothetical protein